MTFKKELISQAVKGTDDYHFFMTQITVTSLTHQAGFIPENTGEIEKVHRNSEHWQTRKVHMSAGNLWIFLATELGHYKAGEARVIWRYGQSLKFQRVFKKYNPEISNNPILMDAITYLIRNPYCMTDGEGDIIYSADDELAIRNICEGIFQMPYEIYPNSFGGIDVERKKYREIVRLIDNLILWVYTGSEYLTTTDKKELFQYMGW